MFEYAGDSFEYLAPTGEIAVLALGAVVWLGYVLTEARYVNDDSLQRILWFTFWMAQLSKSVRSPRVALLGNGVIALVGFIVLVQSMRKTALHFDLLGSYLMAGVLLYTGATLLWHHDPRNLRVFLTGAVLWCAVLLYFRHQDQTVFLDRVFTGFG